MKKIIITLTMLLSIISVWAENFELPLKEVSIFSSGVAYYEHEGEISKNETLNFLFSPQQISDVLKSISVYDAGAKKITLKYDSEDTLQKTLSSLSIDINKNFNLTQLLAKQKGSKIITFTHEKIIGKIISIENINENSESISLLTNDGIKNIKITDIKHFYFDDAKKNEDLNKALDLISKATDLRQKKLQLDLEGSKNRKIKVAYVMESPVWKTSYRLNMGINEGIFQLWAIVDNSSNFDWKNIKLNLITGKPISFKQNLYTPHYINRQEIPLSIEGVAEVAIYDSASNDLEGKAEYEEVSSYSKSKELYKSAGRTYAPQLKENSDVFSATTKDVSNERFIFSPTKLINLERHKSIMIPIKVVTIPAKKISVFSNIPMNTTINPKLCIQIKNTTGLKLPAGPITIFDDGYSGDALIKFLPEDENRLIAYGDDLLLNATTKQNSTNKITKVSIKNGMMKINSSVIFTTIYNIKNNHKNAKTVMIEHNIKRNSKLVNSDKPTETTNSVYRFTKEIPNQKTIDYTVNEEKLISTSYSISNFDENRLMYYSTNSEIPKKVKKIFNNIILKRKEFEEKKLIVNNLIKERQELNNEQERTRKNIEALRNSSQSENFLTKLLSIESKLESMQTLLRKAIEKEKKAKKEYHDFINNINF